MGASISRVALVLAAAAVLTPQLASATRIDSYEVNTRILGIPGTGVPLGDLEPGFHHSFVRNNSLSILSDTVYSDQLKLSGYASIDVVMQQCFGGGFLNDISAKVPNYTFASASGWWQSALNFDLPIPGPGAGALGGLPRTVDNFTRAWRETSAAFNGAGPIFQANLLDNFETARKGLALLPGPVIPNYAIRQDPWAPGGNTIGVEYPQYNSSGAGADGRNLGNEDYAILVAWDIPDARHGINIRRMYDTLTKVYGLPANHIAVLYPGALGATIPIEPSDLSGLGAAPVTSMNQDGNILGVPVKNLDWITALAGLNFGAGPAIGSSHLLVYNTGHGGHAVTLPFLGNFNVGANQKGNWVFSRINGFDYIGDILGDVSLTDPLTLMDDIQLSFSQPMDPSLLLSINGVTIGSLGPADGTMPLDPFVTDPVYSYALQVPHSLIGSMTDFMVEIEGPLGSFSLDPLLLQAVDMRGGDQEFLAINYVPEPGTLLVMAPLAAVSLIRRRRGRAG